MLQVEGKKMSKSLGNFFTVRDLLDQGIPGEVIRFVFLSTHYRKPMDWTAEKAREAEATLRKWAIATEEYPKAIDSNWPISTDVINALEDDLNTPLAISKLHELYSQWRKQGDSQALFLLFTSAEILGINLQKFYYETEHPQSAQVQRKGSILWNNEDDYRLIERLIAKRSQAKESKQWEVADRIRDTLFEAGVSINDTKDGVTWELGPNFDPSKLEALK
jgi:cysteinyl-tRNA synthetase